MRQKPSREYSIAVHHALVKDYVNSSFDPQPGDLIMLRTPLWVKANKGDVFRVLALSENRKKKPTLKLDCAIYGPTQYFHKHNFEYAPIGARETYPTLNQENTNMSIYIAVESTGKGDKELSDMLTVGHTRARDEGAGEGVLMLSDISIQALKTAINAIIQAEPHRTFLIFNSTLIAETSAPPVRFRSI